MRSLIGFFTSTAVIAVALAQAPPASDVPWVVPLSLKAAKEPKPALKYTLLPEARDLTPGNQIQAFYKCFMQQHNFYRGKEAVEQREKWLSAPLKELAQEKGLIDYGGSSARQADYAARLESVDWAILSQLKVEGIHLLLPDVQSLRELASVLKARVRGEIARGEFENALHTIQTTLSLGRAFEYHPTLIGVLVGYAILTIAVEVIEEFIQQPNATSLFWAIADLPYPILDMRRSLMGERAWMNRDFDVLLKQDPLPEAELKRIQKLFEAYVEKDRKETAQQYFLKQVADQAALKVASERLLDSGFTKEKLAALPPLQVVMSDDLLKYLLVRDEIMKWGSLPQYQIPSDEYIKKKYPNMKGILYEYVPAIVNVKQAQSRVQQRVDCLRIAEAIRLSASGNGNKLPASLEELKLPLPVDPFSGKPYLYELKDGKAIVHGFVLPERRTNRSYNRVLEIQLQAP
jgi:hypothetical protein